MAFISYAQNFEDVMLWRALKHVPDGRYIDVGAQHPVIDSVSKAFYEHGWRGVHVEPVLQYADLLRLDRPDEEVMQVALSDREGVLELNVFKDTGLSTAVKPYAQQHAANLAYAYEKVSVPMLRMKTALASLNGTDVHWLKIDVEGFEEQVLKGWDSTVLRPWIILIEATIPLTKELHYAGADRLILDAGYEFVYFDGLNRFYVAKEHPELIGAFSSPPNVFDEFSVSGLASSEFCRVLQQHHSAEIQEKQRQISELQSRLADLQLQTSALQKSIEEESRSFAIENSRSLESISKLANVLHQTNEQLIEAQHERRQLQAIASASEQRFHAVMQSTSWKITAPIRALGTATYKFRAAVSEKRTRAAFINRARPLLQQFAKQIVKRPRLKSAVVHVLDLSPSLKRQLISIVSPKLTPQTSWKKKVSLDTRAEKIFIELKVAMEKRENAQQ